MRSIYCDGFCKNNGKPNARARARVLIVNPDGTRESEWFKVPGLQTNQRAEMVALTNALLMSIKGDRIWCDSQYALNIACGRWRAKTNLDLTAPLRMAYVSARGVAQWVAGDKNLADPNKCPVTRV